MQIDKWATLLDKNYDKKVEMYNMFLKSLNSLENDKNENLG